MQHAQLNPGNRMPGHAAGDIVHIFHVVPNPEVRNACLHLASEGGRPMLCMLRISGQSAG